MRAIPNGRLAATLIAVVTAVVVVIAAVLLTQSQQAPAEAGPVVPRAQHQAPKAKYVALGSSFAAGPGEGKPVGKCGQTLDNYPRQVAAELDMHLVDATCSGASVADILPGLPGSKGKRPQIDSVTPDTSLVTVTIGGNDISYIGRLANSVCANVAAGLFLPIGSQCSQVAWPSAYPMIDRYQAVEASLVAVVHAIRARAPKARVLLVEYLQVVSMNEPPCERLPLEPWQVIETQAVGDQLAAATERAATATGAQFVGAGPAGADHTVCSPDPWLRGYGQSMPFHPNSAGKAAMASEVVRALR